MAKSRSTPAAKTKIPTPRMVEICCDSGQITEALSLSRQILQAAPSAQAVQFFQKTLLQVARQLAETRDLKTFNIVYDEAARLPGDHQWTIELACLQAAGWDYPHAMNMVAPINDPEASDRVTGELVDRSVRCEDDTVLPDSMLDDSRNFTRAFQAYEKGDDATAREFLKQIGLKSVFVEWKLMLRGLLSIAEGDAEKAVENWRRLKPERLPHRMIATLRVPIDPAYRDSLGERELTRIERQQHRLSQRSPVGPVKRLAKELVDSPKLDAAFRTAELAVAELRLISPHLVRSLGNVFYTAIIRQGRPPDLPAYQRIFGEQQDDPNFDRMLAIIFTEADQWEHAFVRWKKYEEWLATGPRGWPAPLLARSRAIVWQAMGSLARSLKDEATPGSPNELFMPNLKLTASTIAPKNPVLRRQKQRINSQLPQLSAAACFARAAALAADWEEPVVAGFDQLIAERKEADAEAFARRYLATTPNSPTVYNRLADSLSKQARFAEALALRLQSLAIVPLDRNERVATAMTYLALARKQAIEGDPVAAEETLDKGRNLCGAELPAADLALRVVLARLRNRTDDARSLDSTASAIPHARLSYPFHISINSIVLKLKTALRSTAAKAYLSELVKIPTVIEARELIHALQMYQAEGHEFTGKKTAEAKVLDSVVRAATNSDASEYDLEHLGVLLQERAHWKTLGKYLTNAFRHFPQNPVLLFFGAVISAQKNPTPQNIWRTEKSFSRARAAAEASPEKRHQDLIPIIDQSLNAYNSLDLVVHHFFS